jgi:hypothetical protein
MFLASGQEGGWSPPSPDYEPQYRLYRKVGGPYSPSERGGKNKKFNHCLVENSDRKSIICLPDRLSNCGSKSCKSNYENKNLSMNKEGLGDLELD